MDKENIKIVGAGPAGLTAGIVLRKFGYSVNLYEKNKTMSDFASMVIFRGWKTGLMKKIL